MATFEGAAGLIAAIRETQAPSSGRAADILATTLMHLQAAEDRDTASRVATLDEAFRYIFWSGGAASEIAGKQAVGAFYDELWASDMQVVNFKVDRVVTDDRSVVVVGRETVAYPGHVARARGALDAADDETWATSFQSCVVWAFDGPDEKMTSATVFASPEFGGLQTWERL